MTDLTNMAEYNEAIGTAGKLVVIDFHASWCPPCQMIKPHFEQWAKDYPEALLVKVDVDANPEASQAADVQAMPTFKFFKDGAEIDCIRGADPDGVKARIEELK